MPEVLRRTCWLLMFFAGADAAASDSLAEAVD